MRQHARRIIGFVLLFFASALYVIYEDIGLPAVVLGVGALLVLYREVIIAALFVWFVLRGAGRLLLQRAKKVEKMRHCSCCGALPVYLVTTCASVKIEGPVPEVQLFLACREHHPNPEIGEKANELHALIRKVHPGITIERIYPYNPY
jgi:hypothetical protein